MSNWFTGSGETVTFQEIVKRVLAHSDKNGQISIGTDSQVRKHYCTFSTAVCLYGADNQSGGRFFVCRENHKKEIYSSLIQRIAAEVEASIKLGMRLQETNSKIEIELHLDISSSDKKEGTSRFSDMLIGYARGAGFECKIKPDSWAAATVADRYSK
jgi:predicted RNase H-related nuclease YkuK (DUF458 family)